MFFTPASAAADPELVKKGEYLMRAGDCIACHTAPGGTPFAGGMYMKTPFGEIATPNLTPDKETGIGDWSDDDFYRAVHEGIGHQDEYLYPVFPFPWYTKVTREDVLAIKAYLFSLKPEHAQNKPLKFAFPFSIRTALLTWRTAFFKADTFKPDPKASDVVNRGAYLVEGLGHCGECHNQNNLLGASDWSGKLEGGQINGWYAPNITSDGKQGVGSWSEDEIATFLKTGSAPGKTVALGPMMETIHDSLSYLSDADLHAMGAYLKAVAAKQTVTASESSKDLPVSVNAQQTYQTYCSSCHQGDGKGIPGAIPALAGNGAVTAKGPQNVIRVVLGGLEAKDGLAPMPAVGQAMTDDEIAAAVNYVRSSWGNTAPETAGPGEVQTARKDVTTMLSSHDAGACPKIADQKLAQAVDAAAVQDQLKDTDNGNMLGKIDAIVPKLKASLPGVQDDDIVNALTVAYCPIALGDTKAKPAQRSINLGNFASLVYGQIKRRDAKN
ncbi:cytochrome c [Beijerinckia sp. L45]|uniref:c-type cytochrome n=1 Tax=Beijerinckia sp. L45 TaxID=1641855 RepID=UPI001FEF32AD|nr:cytochrome c [Beijerinckia sp. L45]